MAKLIFEMQKEDAYWTTDHWARLGREGAMSGLMGMQAGLGGYARARRWADSPEQRGKELQALLTMLFKPQLQAEGLNRVEHGSSEGIFIAGYQAKELHLTLPGADPERTLLYLCLANIDGHTPRDYTPAFLASLRSEWLPAQQGMGLRLSGKPPIAVGNWELRVRYHSPLAMGVGVLEEETNELIIGGAHGMRYLIRADRVTEHLSADGKLPSDDLPDHEVKPTLLTPKERP